jgi:hypothetical protein
MLGTPRWAALAAPRNRAYAHRAALAAPALGCTDRATSPTARRTYPSHVDEPLRTFIEGVNALGLALDDSERDALVTELPRAMIKASALLAPLAREG